MMDEMRLTRYLDGAIRDFNRAVGILPAICAIPDQHGYFGILWKISQENRYVIPYRERVYEWIDVYLTFRMKENEIYLFLYYNPKRVYGLKYEITNERVYRVTELKDGHLLPSFNVNETLEKLKYKIIW